MNSFELSVLGCGSAFPTNRHNPSAQALCHHDRVFLIDCGEGTQQYYRRQGLKLGRLQHIFISHLHGDHCLGLACFNLFASANLKFIAIFHSWIILAYR